MAVMQFDLWGPHSSETGVYGDTDLVRAMKHFHCPECSQEHSYKRSTGGETTLRAIKNLVALIPRVLSGEHQLLQLRQAVRKALTVLRLA